MPQQPEVEALQMQWKAEVTSLHKHLLLCIVFVVRVSHSDNVVASLFPKCLEFIFEHCPRLRLSATM